MSFRSLLNKTATITRMVAGTDAQGVIRNNPTEQVVGTYPCAASEASAGTSQESPQATEVIGYNLFFPPGADVRTGDLAVIAGVGKLRLAMPYNVRGHHLEVSGAWDGDV